MKKELSQEIGALMSSYPPMFRDSLMALRALVFQVADATTGVGEIEETLKWGQLSFVTAETGAGTTIRIDRFGSHQIALFFHCQTTLVGNYRDMFGDRFQYSKNRAVLLEPTKKIPVRELKLCIGMALTYHLNKKSKKNRVAATKSR